MDKKAMFRGKIDVDLDRKVRAIVVLRRSSLGEAAQEALEEWIKRPENREVIQKHNLE